MKNSKKLWKKSFDAVIDGSLDNAIKGTPFNLKFGSLRVLYIIYSAEQTELGDIFKLGSIDKVRMRLTGRGKRNAWLKV